MELPASHASVEDNGTPFQENAHVPTEIGTASHASNVPQVKDGAHHLFHAHVPTILFGTVSTVELAQVPADSGTTN